MPISFFTGPFFFSLFQARDPTNLPDHSDHGATPFTYFFRPLPFLERACFPSNAHFSTYSAARPPPSADQVLFMSTKCTVMMLTSFTTSFSTPPVFIFLVFFNPWCQNEPSSVDNYPEFHPPDKPGGCFHDLALPTFFFSTPPASTFLFSSPPNSAPHHWVQCVPL